MIIYANVSGQLIKIKVATPILSHQVNLFQSIHLCNYIILSIFTCLFCLPHYVVSSIKIAIRMYALFTTNFYNLCFYFENKRIKGSVQVVVIAWRLERWWVPKNAMVAGKYTHRDCCEENVNVGLMWEILALFVSYLV